MSFLDDAGSFLTGRRGGISNINDIPRVFRNVENARSAVVNHDERVTIEDNRWDTRANRSTEQVMISRDRLERRMYGDNDRGGRDDHRDDRGEFARGHGGRGPQGFANGNGGDREQPGQPRGMSSQDATTEFVMLMTDAVRSPAGSPERAAALREANGILTNPANGFLQANGRIEFPEMLVTLDRQGRGVEFDGMSTRSPSARVAVQTAASVLVAQNIGTPLTDAEIAAVFGTGAPATVTVGTTPPGAATPGAATPGLVAGATQQERNKQAQVMLERLGLTTGTRNHAAFNANNSSQSPEGLMDGIIGPKTRAALVELGIDPNQPITAETLALIQQKSAERIAAENTRNGVQPQTAGTGGPAQGGPAQDAPAPDAARIAAAVTTLTNLESSDAGRAIDAAELAAVTAQDKLLIGRAFDLNNNGRVEEAELIRITAAAAAQPTGVTVAQGVNISSLFAGTSFGATTEVATGTGNTVAAGAALVATGAAVEQAAGQPQQAGQPQTGNANLTQNDVRVQGGLPDVRVATNVRGPVF